MNTCKENKNNEKAPTAINAAQQFLDLSQEYLELVPKLAQQPLPIGQSVGARTTKRVAALAVVMQRKFVTSGENTYMPGILERIMTEHKAGLPQDRRRGLREFQHELVQAINGLHEAQNVFDHESGVPRSTAEVVPQILYGRLVHADYQKWKAGGSHPWFVASRSFMVAQDKFREYILRMRTCLIELAELEILRELQFERSVQEDSLTPDGYVH